MTNEEPTELEMLIQDERIILEDIAYTKEELTILEGILNDTRTKLSKYTV